MSGTARRATRTGIEPLTRNEIELRIQDLIMDVSAPRGREAGLATAAEGYRWMAPADLVQRMRPYLSPN